MILTKLKKNSDKTKEKARQDWTKFDNYLNLLPGFYPVNIIYIIIPCRDSLLIYVLAFHCLIFYIDLQVIFY